MRNSIHKCQYCGSETTERPNRCGSCGAARFDEMPVASGLLFGPGEFESGGSGGFYLPGPNFLGYSPIRVGAPQVWYPR